VATKTTGMSRVASRTAFSTRIVWGTITSGLEARQLRSSAANVVYICTAPMHIDLDIAAIQPAKLRESLPKSCNPRLPLRVITYPHQYSDISYSLPLLCPYRERPHRRAARQRDEIASPHLLALAYSSHILLCIAAELALRLPPWVKRVVSTRPTSYRHVRCASDSDRIGDSRQSIAWCHKETYAM
jgi:hypothetical protein